MTVDLRRSEEDQENGSKVRVPEEFSKEVRNLGPSTSASSGKYAADEVPVKFSVGEVVGDHHAKGHVVEDLCDLKGVGESRGLVPEGHHGGLDGAWVRGRSGGRRC